MATHIFASFFVYHILLQCKQSFSRWFLCKDRMPVGE